MCIRDRADVHPIRTVPGTDGSVPGTFCRETPCPTSGDSVGTQWETRGKTQRYTLKTKTSPQKKVLSLVLCVAMLLSVMVMGTGAASFTDQDEFSDNYAEAAEVLTGMGIIQGYDDGSFLPQRNINRAQVATMIYRAATGDVNDSKISQFVGEDPVSYTHLDVYKRQADLCSHR